MDKVVECFSVHNRTLVRHHLVDTTGTTVTSSRRHAVAMDQRTTTLNNVTGVVMFTVMISVQLQKLSVIIAIVSVTFWLSVAVADVLIITLTR